MYPVPVTRLQRATAMLRGRLHRWRRGRPRNILGTGFFASLFAGLTSSSIYRCQCGAMARISIDGVEGLTGDVPLCPMFGAAAIVHVRAIKLPPARVVRR